MYDAISQSPLISETTRFRSKAASVLSISKSLELIRALGLADVRIDEADFPEFDILDLPYPAATFDFVVADQVLEHVAGNPFDAVSETLRILKPGGVAVMTTCLMNPIHYGPSDCWRFTPEGLMTMFDREDICQYEVDAWGNRAALLLVALGFRSLPVPDRKGGGAIQAIATYNEPNWPIVTWAIAQKRLYR